MIAMIFAAVALACGVYVTFLVGKDFGREEGYCDGRSETYRDLIHIIEHYKELADAKDTPTKGA